MGQLDDSQNVALCGRQRMRHPNGCDGVAEWAGRMAGNIVRFDATREHFKLLFV